MLSKATITAYANGVDSISDSAAEYVAAVIGKAADSGASIADLREVAIEAIMGAGEEHNAMVRELACTLYERQTGQTASFTATFDIDREAVDRYVRYHAGKLREGRYEAFVSACTEQARWLTRLGVNEEIIGNCRPGSKRKHSRRKHRKGASGVRFARVPRGGDTCTFCAMLASRGFVYWSRKSAGEFSHYHRHCRCLVVPDDGSGEVEGYDPIEWEERWGAYEEIDATDLTKEQSAIAKTLVTAGVPVSRASELARNLPRVDFATAGSIYANSSTELCRYARKVKPLEGYHDVVIHGDGRSFSINDADDNYLQDISVEELAAIIRKDRRYNGGPIRLLSCNAGQYSDGAAQELSNTLGVEVLGPTQAVNIDSAGNIAVADDMLFAKMALEGIIKEPGKWISYFPTGGQS